MIGCVSNNNRTNFLSQKILIKKLFNVKIFYVIIAIFAIQS